MKTNCFLGEELANAIGPGPRISPTGDKNGLILTYEKGVYSFHCDTPSQCYWRTEPYNLEIKRKTHMMNI